MKRIHLATGHRPLVGPVETRERVLGFEYAWGVQGETLWAVLPGQPGRGDYSYDHGGAAYRALVDAMAGRGREPAGE